MARKPPKLTSTELVEHLAVLREAAGAVLVPELLSVREHGELAAPPADELHVGIVLGLNGGRETRSLGLVVSHHAVADFDSHARSVTNAPPSVDTPAPARSE